MTAGGALIQITRAKIVRSKVAGQNWNWSRVKPRQWPSRRSRVHPAWWSSSSSWSHRRNPISHA